MTGQIRIDEVHGLKKRFTQLFGLSTLRAVDLGTTGFPNTFCVGFKGGSQGGREAGGGEVSALGSSFPFPL